MLPEHIKKYVKDVVGLCEATDCERFYLWQEYKEYWKECRSGYGLIVGTTDDRPTMLSLLVDEIKGKKILFYYATSQLVDHNHIDNWLRENFKVLLSRHMKTNATNFANIVNRL